MFSPNFLFSILLVALLAFWGSAEHRNYDGYSVLRVKVNNEKQFRFLSDFGDQNDLDFWSDPAKDGNADILVTPENRRYIQKTLRAAGISSSIMIGNLGTLVEEQYSLIAEPQAGMNWTNYHSLETIYSWLDDLEKENTGTVQVSTIGRSTEDRPIKLVRISSSLSDSKKPAFWIDATIHAREWIATTTATFVINELVNNASHYQDILDKVDFYILPMVNPDGYEYSRNVDRLWRKSRSKLINSTCIGVDVNRNFDYKWSAANNDKNQCTLTHQGPYPFSEPEAAAIRNYILRSGVNWQGFITLHSYSQLWMTPWGYTRDLPADYDEMLRVGKIAAEALTAVHGTRYTVGSASNILYPSEGTSRDWAKGAPNITYVYTIELRDTGAYGFVLPPAQILPTGQETWAGIRVVAEEIAKRA